MPSAIPPTEKMKGVVWPSPARKSINLRFSAKEEINMAAGLIVLIGEGGGETDPGVEGREAMGAYKIC